MGSLFTEVWKLYVAHVQMRKKKFPDGNSLSVWLTKDKGHILEHLSLPFHIYDTSCW